MRGLLRPQFLDGGDHLILPGQFLILVRVVVRQVGDRNAESLQQPAGFVQFVAEDIRLAIGIRAAGGVAEAETNLKRLTSPP